MEREERGGVRKRAGSSDIADCGGKVVVHLCGLVFYFKKPSPALGVRPDPQAQRHFLSDM